MTSIHPFVHTVWQAIKQFVTKHKPKPKALSIEDPVAQETQWRPLFGRQNYLLASLNKRSDDRIELHAARSALIASIAVAFLGILITLIAAKQYITQASDISLSVLFIGLALSAVGFMLKQRAAGIIYFDKTSQSYGIQSPSFIRLLAREETHPLANIYAMQVLTISAAHRQKTIWQINFVLSDSSRYHLVNMQSAQELEQLKTSISEFLKVPVWDISS